MKPIFIVPPEKEIFLDDDMFKVLNLPVNISIVKSIDVGYDFEVVQSYGFDPHKISDPPCIMFVFIGGDRMSWIFNDIESRDIEYTKLLEKWR